MKQPYAVRDFNWTGIRQFERFPTDIPVKIAKDSFVCRGWCKDISVGGIGATVAGDFAVGETVQVDLLIQRCGKPITVEAVVRRSQGFSYGLEFLTLSADQRACIERQFNRIPARTKAEERPVVF